MKVLVTGGAGFIGSHIVDRLVEIGHETAVVDNLRSGKKENLNPKAKFYQVDVTDKQSLEDTFLDWKPEIVFHLAAQNEVPFSMDHPYEDQQMNIVGMMNLCEAARTTGTKKIIYSNTGGALYGDVPPEHIPISEDEPIYKPTSFYGVSKGAAENYLKLYGNLYNFSWVALRYANVYGPRQMGNKEAGVVAIFTQKLLEKQTPNINGDGEYTRDYVFVGDVAAANIKAIDYPENDFFNIATGIQTTTNQVFDAIENVLKTGITPTHGPQRAGDTPHNALNPQKAAAKLNWKPEVDFKEGVKITVEFYNK